MSIANATLSFINDETRATYDHGGPAPAEVPRGHVTVITDDARDRAIACGLVAAGMYLYLEGRADKDGRCWPSYQTIAKDTGISRRQVMRIIHDLVTAGLIVIEPRTNPNGSPDTNAFFLPFHPMSPPSAPESPPRDIHVTTPSDMNGGVVTLVSPKVVPVNPPSSNSKKSVSRKTRLNPEYRLTVEQYQQAQERHGFTREQIDRELELFVNHWVGNGETKANWDATWRNWIAKEKKWSDQRRPAKSYQTKEDKRQHALDYFMKRAQEAP